MSSQFRKLPVVVDAWQAIGVREMGRIVRWICASGGDAVFRPEVNLGPAVDIETLEGRMSAGIGDWIIKGVKGEFYPCKPDIFTATYEAVAISPTSAQAPPEPPEEWVCSWCGDEWDPGDTFSSGCCSCDPMPASGLPAALKDARREAQEAIDEAWDEAVADAKRIALLEAEVVRLEAVAEAARQVLRGLDRGIWPSELQSLSLALEDLGGNGVASSAGEPE